MNNNKIVTDKINEIIKRDGFFKVAHRITKELKFEFELKQEPEMIGAWREEGYVAPPKYDYKLNFGLVCKELSKIRRDFDISKIEDLKFLEMMLNEEEEYEEKVDDDCFKKYIEFVKELDNNIKFNFTEKDEYEFDTNLNISMQMLFEIKADRSFLIESFNNRKSYRMMQIAFHPDKYKFKNEILAKNIYSHIVKIKERL